MKSLILKRSISGGTMAVLFGLMLLAINSANACSFDTDCSPGSKCVKSGGQIYGVCAGGISPGNSNDRQPVYSPLDPNGTVGNTCSFNTDCGPGNICAKSGGITGVCVRG